MLVRVLGKDKEALSKTWDMPFTDVADWAKPYVGYAYANGLTTRRSVTLFGGQELVTGAQFITFILRALGCESGKDFEWSNPYSFFNNILQSNNISEYYNMWNLENFTRGDAARISKNALYSKLKDSETYLLRTLVDSGAVDAKKISVSSYDTFLNLSGQYVKYNGKLNHTNADGVSMYTFNCMIDMLTGEFYFIGDSLGAWINIAFGTFVISTTNEAPNKFVDGTLVFSSKFSPFTVTNREEQESISKKVRYNDITYNGKTLTTPSQQNDIRIIGESEIWYSSVNYNDFCKFFNITPKSKISYEKIDDIYVLVID